MGERRSRAARIRRVLGGAAVGLLLAALVIGLLRAPTDWLLVVGSTVVRPAPIAWSLVGIAILLSLVRVLMDPGLPAPRRRSWRKALRLTVVVILSLSAMISSTNASVHDLGSQFLVLEPAGPDGCRVVVEEFSLLRAGWGTIHVLASGEHRTRRVGDWWVDEDYRPISLGGRKPLGDGPARVVPVRLDDTLLNALDQRAEHDRVTRSELIRAALRAYVA